MVKFPPPVSDVLAGSHDEIYFVCLMKLQNNKSTLESIDCLKGGVVESLNEMKGLGGVRKQLKKSSSGLKR